MDTELTKNKNRAKRRKDHVIRDIYKRRELRTERAVNPYKRERSPIKITEPEGDSE